MQYDTGTLAGRRKLGKKLALREDEVLDAVSDAGLTPYTTLTDTDAAEIARFLGPSSNEGLLGSWQKCLAHAKRDAVRRCQRYAEDVQGARLDVFGHTRPPFRNNIDDARHWIQNVLNEEFDSKADELPWEFRSWLFEGEFLHGEPGIIGKLSEHVECLEQRATVTRLQAMLYILTNDILVDQPPLTIRIVGQYGVPLRVIVSAEDYVPSELVSYAYSQARRMATGRARARPGPKRDAATPRGIAEVLLERVEHDLCAEITIDPLKSEIWREIAPGISQPPTSVSSTISRTAMNADGREIMVPDLVTVEWELDLSEIFEQDA